MCGYGKPATRLLSLIVLLGWASAGAQPPGHPPSLSYAGPSDEARDGSPQSLSVTVGKRFTIREAGEGEFLIHPILSHLADGKLLLRSSPDSDIVDEEQFATASTDGGNSWKTVPDWPMNNGAGRHIRQVHTLLPDGRSLVVSAYLVSTGQENKYILPAYISSQDGVSFSRIDSVPFQFHVGKVADFQDPAEWPTMKRGGPKPGTPNFHIDQGKPSQLMSEFRAEYGKKWLIGLVSMLYPLDDSTLLAFVYVSTELDETSKRHRFVAVCLESTDWGRSWAVRSVPGPWDPALEKKNRREKPLDGFCEPSVTRLRNGGHLIVMRIGAWQRLYSARSTDGCRTWSKPKEISVFGILPTVLTLPDGVLALCTGRPDNTLSFSVDDGESWPWTLRLLDQTNPDHPSTRNNTMIQVAPGRLLYVYDYGYRRPDAGVNVPHAIEGVFVDVSMVPQILEVPDRHQ